MNFDEEHAIETFKSLITISVEGLKVLLLVNGGAVVAILAFLGQSSVGPNLAPHFWWPIGLFVGGVTCCAIAFLGSYFTQFALFNEHFPKRAYRGPNHMTCFAATVGFVLASVVCFALGAFSSVSVLANQSGLGAAKPATLAAQAMPSPAPAAELKRLTP